MSETRKLHVKSFGCQMNVYDSHRMADTLAPAGFTETAQAEDADLIILNTCNIREKRGRENLFRARPLREMKQEAAREGRKMMIAVAGCVAQAQGREIMRRAPGVDVVVGSQNYHRLPELLARAERGEKIVDTEFPVEDKFDALAAPARDAIRARGISAFVTVQEGCDKFCTFCVVPYTRGAEVSRPVEKIVAEVERAGRRWRARSHADRPERQRLSRRRRRRPRLDTRPIASPAGASAGHRAAALHDQPSARHGRHADRRASRPAGADADGASAGAVRLRRDPGGDEPQAHARGLSRARSSVCARARPDIAFTSDFIVGFPGETDADFARHAVAGRGGRLLPTPIRSAIRRVPARRPPRWTARFPTPRRMSGFTACRH